MSGPGCTNGRTRLFLSRNAFAPSLADELLVAWTGILGGALLTAATPAGASLFRRVQELRDRILALEASHALRPIKEFILQYGAESLQNLGGRRRAR